MKILLIGGTGTLGHAIYHRYSGQHDFTVVGRRPVPWADVAVANIERIEDVHRVMGSQHFEVVLHLAANKHVSVCEANPSQAVHANILGTMHVLAALRDWRIPQAVFVSTDKACQPCSVYGISKLIAERLVQEAVGTHPTQMASLRMGNIFGSTGSVIPLWRRMAREGQIVVRRLNGQSFRRFGVTPSQAAALVMGALGRTGVLIPKAMPNYSINTLAQVFSEKHGCSVVFGEAVAGERCDELLLSEEESRCVRDADDYFVLERTPHRPGRELSTATQAVASHAETATLLEAVERDLDWYLER